MRVAIFSSQAGGLLCLGVTLLLTAAGCSQEPKPEPTVRALLRLPDYLPEPVVPDFNPLTREKIELGRFLFYDKRLSGNQTQSCASCHQQSRGFSDGLATAVGSTGQAHPRNSQGLANVAYFTSYTWGNNKLKTLEQQIRIPIVSDSPVELGVLDNVRADVLARFSDNERYRELFAAAFPDAESPVSVKQIVYAIASFCRVLISADSPFDRYRQGDRAALTESQVRGFQLTTTERLECFHCHRGTNFTISFQSVDTPAGAVQQSFFNTGLYNIAGSGDYPPGNQGIFELSEDPGDRGKFRAQSWRNIAQTAPYMHDGSIATLEEVVLHYANGGRNIPSGPLAGDGREHPNKSGFVRGFSITDQELQDVVSFLESLTDEKFLTNPRFSDPFTLETF